MCLYNHKLNVLKENLKQFKEITKGKKEGIEGMLYTVVSKEQLMDLIEDEEIIEKLEKQES